MPSANVRRIESVEAFHGILVQYAEGLCLDVSELAASLHRLEDVFTHQYPTYWRREEKIAEQKLNEAELSLSRIEATVRSADKPAAISAKQRVNQARKRHRLCQSKVRSTKQIGQMISRQIEQLAGPVAAIRRTGENDLPMAAIELKQIVARLRQYAS